MLKTLSGWTTAKPPDAVSGSLAFSAQPDKFQIRTEELLAAALLNDLDKARFQLFDGRNVAREDTHIAGLGRKIDLDAILRF